MLSALWHQLHQWLPYPPVAVLAPVAESVWEHVKIVWYPTLLYWVIVQLCCVCKKDGLRLWAAATLQAAVGVAGMIALYYTAHAGLGIGQVLWVDLLCEGAALGLGAMAAARYCRHVTTLQGVGFALVWLTMALLLGWLTFYYPPWPIFQRL